MRFEKKGVPFFVAKKRKPRGGLILPTSSRLHGRQVVDRCVVPVPDDEGGTRPCGHPRFEGESVESFERGHVVDCLRRNHETIMEVRDRQHPEIMRPWDPELADWVKEHGVAILEGRKRI